MLFNIFYDGSQQISEDYIDDFKKLSKALLIEGYDLQGTAQKFYDFSINKFTGQLDEQNLTNISNKKKNLLIMMDNVSLNGIEYKDDLEFRKKFRNKFGITEKNIDDQELDKIIKANKKD